MIVGNAKIEIERIIDDLKFTVGASSEVAEHYKRSFEEHPNQTQWLKPIGKAIGRAELAQQVIDKLNALIQE
jgi:hypothetical protein